MYKIVTLAAIAFLSTLNKNRSADLIEHSAYSFETSPTHLKNGKKFTPFEFEKSTATETWSANWFNAVKDDIRKSEYNFTREEKSKTWCSPNRANNLRFFCNENGFSVEPLTTKVPVGDIKEGQLPNEVKYRSVSNWKINFRLDLNQAGTGKWQASGNEAGYVNNNIDVQYINAEDGLRQNFIVHKQQAGRKKLRINFNVCTKLKLFLHGNQLQFFNRKSEQVLNYDQLKVWDANGKQLTASIKKRKAKKFSISVDINDAVYPISIDPLSSTPNNILHDANQSNSSYGNSVASAGDVNGDGYSDVIIGAPAFSDGPFTNEGRVFVYLGSSAGLSVTPDNVFSYANQSYGYFGRSVSSAGDVNGDGYSDVIIGAEEYDNDYTDEGVAFVHYGSGSGLSAVPNSVLDDGDQDGLYFGYSVACAGDVNGDGYSDVIVGATFYDATYTDQGAAFVYYGGAGGLAAGPGNIISDVDQAASYYGLSVASAGDVNGDGYSDVMVGAYLYDDGANNNEGRAYVYFGSVTGLPAVANAILDDADQPDAFMGRSLASAGDVNGDGYGDLIVGADFYDDGANINEGRVFIYYGSATGPSAAPNIFLGDANQAGANFGYSVACAGDINGDGYADVIIGAYGYDDGANINEGRAFVYFGSATGPSIPASTPNDANQNTANFGNSVACAGDINGDGYSDVIIGAYGYDEGANTNEGRAYVYHGSPDGLTTSSSWQTESNQFSAYYGISVASAGDVNSDGYSDVLVGAYTYTTGASQDGKAYLYLGSATGLSITPAWTAIGSMSAEYFGAGLASAGDVNGDGYGDVLVGGYGYSNGQSQEGRAYLFYGSAAGLAVSPAWTKESNFNTGIFGITLATAGDVNGDGYSDVVIGGFQVSNPLANEGKVYVFYGSAGGLAATENWTMEGEQANAYFGSAVSTAGDVNGDGFADLLVGAYQYSNPELYEGKVFLYYGSATGLSATAIWSTESNQASAFFGKSANCAGDVNGDGYSDVIVGAYQYSSPEANEGRVFVYYGSAAGLTLAPNWTAEINQAGAIFGYSVSPAGDVNGDGYSDILVGARGYSNGQSNEGALYAYYGSATGLPATASWFIESNINNILLGHSVAVAGDVNGDGYSDVIAGAPYFANGQSNEGGAFAYMGNSPGNSLRNNLRFYNNDLVTPYNSSNFVIGNFGVGLFSKSYLGRQKGKLVWETRLNYNAYSGIPITNSTAFTAQDAGFTDLGIAGKELKSLITKILGSAQYTKVRARVKYSPATAITGQVYGPWRGLSDVVDGNHFGALPVELISFTAAWKEKGRSALINFITEKETGICCYDIEKSLDGFNFNSIGSIAARNTAGTQSYRFTDNAAINQKQFYRLKIRATDGKIEYSNIQQLQFKNLTEIIVFPNPATDLIRINLNNDYSKADVRILNSAGQSIRRYSNLPVSNQTLQINVSDLPKGNYWLQLQSGIQQQLLQFIKQ